MKVSDDEFDRIFESELSDLTAEPSAQVWGNIALELKRGKNKPERHLPYLQMAASVVVLMATGLFLLPKPERITLHGNYDPKSVIQADKAILQSQIGTYSLPGKSHWDVVTVENPAKTLATDGGDVPSNTLDQAPVPNLTDTLPVVQAATPHAEPVLAALNSSGSNLSVMETTAPVVLVEAKPNKGLITNAGAADQPIAPKRKKIRGITDLLNLVIATVDKRPDKIIEFSDDDDDESFDPTRINLGQIHAGKHN